MASARTIDIIAFDLDDTLYKERDFVISGRRAVANNIAARYALDPDQLLDVMHSAASTNAFDALAAWLSARIDNFEMSTAVTRMVDIYRYHKPDLTLASDVADTLAELLARGYQLAIITDGRTISQTNKIEALGLSKFIAPANILISETIGAEKTSPRPFELLMEVSRPKPGECTFTYVGDNPAKDFLWPNRLGWTTILLRDTEEINIHPQQIPTPTPDYLPKHTITTLPHLLHLYS